MTAVFFFGTLRDPDLLAIVIGRADAPGELRPALAPGHAARTLKEQAYPHLVAEPGASAEGVVFNADEVELDRLAFFEEAEYVLAPIGVDTPAGPVDARYFRATERLSAGDGLWDFDAWRRREKPVAIEAARELMAHYGAMTASEADRLWPGIMIRARMRARAKATPPVTGRLRQRHGPEDVQSLGVDRPWTGFFALEEHRLRHRLFDGGWSAEISRTVLAVGDAVTVVPYDPARDLVLLIEQFRAAMYVRDDPCPWGVEAIAGRLDQETDAEAAARREAREEAGIELGRIETIAACYTTPGFAAEHVTSLIGEADLGDAGGLFGEAHEHEDIRAFTVPLDEALAGIASGEIDNAQAILSLLWLARNRARLRAEWTTAGVEGGRARG